MQVLSLTEMPLATILAFWRPGSHDWSWAEEYADIMARPETKAIEEKIDAAGFGFIDFASPILLGNDGRVWDGHHRICIAIGRNQHLLKVEVS